MISRASISGPLIACVLVLPASIDEVTGASRTRPVQASKDTSTTGRSGRRSAPQAEPAFLNEVPKHPVDIILGRPTKDAVTVSVLTYADVEGHLTYGTEPGRHTARTAQARFPKGEPVQVAIGSLQPDTRYHYQFHYHRTGVDAQQTTGEHTFHTHRPPGRAFRFTVQADPHLDEQTAPALYERTLSNALLDRPDFHIDLGDTFMAGKIRKLGIGDPFGLYTAQRYYFGLLCHSAPLFLVLGNHDGGSARDDSSATVARKRYYPNPFPNGFYTGNAKQEAGVGLPENYYAWHWGDALFITLDPFRYSRSRRGRPRDNWYRTLGEDQYRWLKATLEGSEAALKFVFIHHLVGGLDHYGRGGAEAAKLYEWGGRGEDGRSDFGRQRPGWDSPIHDLLVRHRVSAVFHGHDHFFAKQDLDGILYQLVPQPGHRGRPRREPKLAQEYGYVNGDFLGSPGHLRVSVTPEEAKVEYVQSALPDRRRRSARNAEVVYSYVIQGRR